MRGEKKHTEYCLEFILRREKLWSLGLQKKKKDKKTGTFF